ncbi:MAG: pyrroloquinoline quinone-dependent dehydrogenase, partial [Gemmatimonadota bacterium]|nr:pyrroloquinoline quinone-dependent dehydrogenase [Gemmatimonadota bacterium]
MIASRTFVLVSVALITGCVRSSLPPPTALRPPPAADWSAYGRTSLGDRFSPLAQITRENVGQLAPAWSFSTREATEPHFRTRRRTSLETTPLVVDGVMYFSSPLGRVFALDPVTGRLHWEFNPQVPRDTTFGDFTNRGVSTWLDPAAPADAPCRRRIYVGTIDARLIALDARAGTPCADFGTGGTVDLRRGLRIAPFEFEAYELTSPPAVINGLVVTGSAIADNSRLAPASGEVRAFDARTGALRWTWDPVPTDPRDPAFDGWRAPGGVRAGAANTWSVIAADPERDLVIVPTSSAAPDYYGGERLGDNRYANSVVALRASTGQVVWHFQTVHHDLWDYDNASPPALVTIRRGGRDTPAVLQATKSGMLFVLHRETGEPLFPVEERAVPASKVPGEQASPTQPFSSIVLSPHRFPIDSVFGLTEADRAACRDVVARLRNEGIFTPPSREGTLVLPSNIGGAHWGGVAYDPERQIVVVPVNRIAATVQLIPADSVDIPRTRRAGAEGGFETTHMRGTPYLMQRRILLSPSRVPCTPPPFGALVAISLSTGQKLWEVPLGRWLGQAPGAPPLGSANLGGPIVTAGGLVFVAATLDRQLRAFDIETGRELWSAPLPAGGKATPMTYRGADGRQYVAIAAGGDGEAFGKSDVLMTFALP